MTSFGIRNEYVLHYAQSHKSSFEGLNEDTETRKLLQRLLPQPQPPLKELNLDPVVRSMIYLSYQALIPYQPELPEPCITFSYMEKERKEERR